MREEKILTQLAQRIRELRRIKEMSQEQLAERADLHPTFIGKIERAEINPSMITIEKIAQAFKIPVSELLSFPDDNKIYDKNAEALVDSLDKATKELIVAKDLARKYKAKKKTQ